MHRLCRGEIWFFIRRGCVASVSLVRKIRATCLSVFVHASWLLFAVSLPSTKENPNGYQKFVPFAFSRFQAA